MTASVAPTKPDAFRSCRCPEPRCRGRLVQRRNRLCRRRVPAARRRLRLRQLADTPESRRRVPWARAADPPHAHPLSQKPDPESGRARAHPWPRTQEAAPSWRNPHRAGRRRLS